MLLMLLLSILVFVAGPVQAMKWPHEEGSTAPTVTGMALPRDVLSLILAKAFDTSEGHYIMQDDNECMSCEKLLIPYSLRSIDPIAACDQKGVRPADLKAQPGGKITLNTQLWQ